MNLSLADVKAVADSRWKSPVPGWLVGVWLLAFILLVVPVLIIVAKSDVPTTYTIPEGLVVTGNEVKVNGGQLTIANIILEQTSPKQDWTLAWVMGTIAGVWYLAIIPFSVCESQLKAKYRQGILETWSRTKEIPEEVKQ
jgi:hypothetical protein